MERIAMEALSRPAHPFSPGGLHVDLHPTKGFLSLTTRHFKHKTCMAMHTLIQSITQTPRAIPKHPTGDSHRAAPPWNFKATDYSTMQFNTFRLVIPRYSGPSQLQRLPCPQGRLAVEEGRPSLHQRSLPPSRHQWPGRFSCCWPASRLRRPIGNRRFRSPSAASLERLHTSLSAAPSSSCVSWRFRSLH